MPELGPMMRALELQRLIEDKVTEWRERSARVAGASVADSYHQPINFKRHTNRRKNSAEINRIIAKYSKPNKRADERYVPRFIPEIAPTRPARHKKNNLKLSKSEDNLANIGMETRPDPKEVKPPPRTRFNLAKYNAKSYEDITAFVDVHHSRKSENFEESSILNAKVIKNDVITRPKLHSIGEDLSEVTVLNDSGIEIMDSSSFTTSTPLSKRKTYPAGTSDDSSSVGFEKCDSYKVELRKGSSEPDIISVSTSVDSVSGTKTLDGKKRWKLLKQPFKKGTFNCLLIWRGRKSTSEKPGSYPTTPHSIEN